MESLNKMILENEKDLLKEQLERLQNRLDRCEIDEYKNLIEAVNRQIKMIEDLLKEESK